MSNESNRVYQKSILHEVIFEARYPLILNINNKIAQFQERIQDQYPYAHKEFISQILLFQGKSDSDGFETNPLESEIIWRFSNDDEDEVSIFSNKITLKISNYHSWKNHQNRIGFKSKIIRLIDNFKKIWRIPRFERIGLRYINKKEFIDNISSSSFERFFIPIFNIKKYPIEELVENRIRIRKKCTDNTILTIQYAFQYSRPDKQQFDLFFLDFDSFVIKIQPNLFEKMLEILHANIINEFESLITNNLRVEMKYDA
ncbi:MAG: TIGR04255 family protein [Candidatus Lokiarchaeota archaeon]|nr:TIGR04255 family protein [Candidatus Harpocratesius repetitus]